MKRVTLTEIHHRRPRNAPSDSPMFLYAIVTDYETGELEISATLDYCLQAIKERNWTICLPKKS